MQATASTWIDCSTVQVGPWPTADECAPSAGPPAASLSRIQLLQRIAECVHLHSPEKCWHGPDVIISHIPNELTYRLWFPARQRQFPQLAMFGFIRDNVFPDPPVYDWTAQEQLPASDFDHEIEQDKIWETFGPLIRLSVQTLDPSPKANYEGLQTCLVCAASIVASSVGATWERELHEWLSEPQSSILADLSSISGQLSEQAEAAAAVLSPLTRFMTIELILVPCRASGWISHRRITLPAAPTLPRIFLVWWFRDPSIESYFSLLIAEEAGTQQRAEAELLPTTCMCRTPEQFLSFYQLAQSNCTPRAGWRHPACGISRRYGAST